MTHSELSQHDPVEHPRHYTFGAVEVISAIEAWALPFHLACVVKYVARAAHKGKYLEDLRKARWYLDREIQRAQKAEAEAEAQMPLDDRSVAQAVEHSAREQANKRLYT
jgi:hypothetical protein